MTQSMLFAILALASALLLLFQTRHRIWPVVAAIAAGLHLLIVSGILRLAISGVSLTLVLGIALLVAGVMSWLKVTGKLHVTAAAVIGLLGLLMALTGFVR